jgi:hypothetical protein
MRFLKEKLIYLTVSSLLLLSGCGSDLPDFPTDRVYSVRPFDNKCAMHKIIVKDPVTLGPGVYVDMKECAYIFGFNPHDTAEVFQWVRKAQKLAEKRCK